MTLNIDDLGTVYEALFAVCAKAYNIGLKLEVAVGTLDSIMKQYSDPSDQLRETLKAWLKMATQQKWQTIVDALRSRIIGEPTLASDIEAKYCQDTPGQASGQAMPKDSQTQALQQKVTEVLQHLESKTQTIEQLEQKLREQHHAIEGLQSMNQSATQPQPNPPQQEMILSKLIWERDGPKVEEAMCRGSAATDGTMVYCIGCESVTVHLYHSDAQRWSRMPNLPNVYSTLVMNGRKLISVGGSEDPYGPTNSVNSVLSLTRGRWLQLFPLMPTKRHSTAAICHDRSLIVAGGHDDHNELTTVEVLNMKTQLWSIASSLPHPFSEATITVCGDRLYLLGGQNTQHQKSNSVFTCSISKLFKSRQAQSKIWRDVADAPCELSSCTTLCGQLVAVGGKDEAERATTAVSAYDESTDSWLPMEAMKEPRWWALVASLHDNTMMVVGGLQLDQELIDTVEIATCF